MGVSGIITDRQCQRKPIQDACLNVLQSYFIYATNMLSEYDRTCEHIQQEYFQLMFDSSVKKLTNQIVQCNCSNMQIYHKNLEINSEHQTLSSTNL